MSYLSANKRSMKENQCVVSLIDSLCGKRNFTMNRKMKRTKGNIICSLNVVLTIPELKTHPFSLNYGTIRFDKSKHFGPNSWDPLSVYKYLEKMRIYRKHEIDKIYIGLPLVTLYPPRTLDYTLMMDPRNWVQNVLTCQVW